MIDERRSADSSLLWGSVGVVSLILLVVFIEPNPGRARLATREDPQVLWGTHYVEDAIRNVANGWKIASTSSTVTFTLDARREYETQRLECLVDVCLEGLVGFRQDVDVRGLRTTEVWDGQKGWRRVQGRGLRHLDASAEDDVERDWIERDRRLYRELVRAITLVPFVQPASEFRYLGPTTGSGTYAGKWLKVSCSTPGEPEILLWLAYQGSGASMEALHPGVVRVLGDPLGETPTLDFVLRCWTSAEDVSDGQVHYPRKILAMELLEDDDGRPSPLIVLDAIVESFRIDETE